MGILDKFTSPIGGKRGCLCEDGETYDKDCCKGELINQGIGSLDGQSISDVQNVSQERVINNISK
jgi:hypothetical protein